VRRTPNYFAPELIASDFNTRTSHTFYDHPSSDIWAFGILLIELTQGQLPWVPRRPCRVRVCACASTRSSSRAIAYS